MGNGESRIEEPRSREFLRIEEMINQLNQNNTTAFSNEEMVEESDSDNDDDDNNDESTNRKGCVVCFGRKSVEKLKKSTGNCKHERDICRKCFNSHVKARLDDKGDVNINCPTLNCKEIIYPDD